MTRESCCAAAPSAKITVYRPLIVALGISVAVATAMAAAGHGSLMNNAMGLFLLALAALHFADRQGFAALFSGYDLLARRWPRYALAYPFLEVLVGAFYMAGWWPVPTNAIMLVIMLASLGGVMGVLRRGEKLNCACAGSGNLLPVGRVTLAEYAVMALMATINLAALAR